MVYTLTQPASVSVVPKTCNQLNSSVAFLPRCGPGRVFMCSAQGTPRDFPGRPWGLRYTGFGGTGKQVRDVSHPTDLFRLVALETTGWSP